MTQTCRALWYSRTPQRMGARGLPAVVPRWPFGVGQPLSAEWALDGPHAVPAACIITDYSTSTSLWQVRIELTTLGLWDLRAANCAIAAMMVSKNSSSLRQSTPAVALSCMLIGCMRSVLLRLCAAELPTQNKIRRIWSDITPIAHELP